MNSSASESGAVSWRQRQCSPNGAVLGSSVAQVVASNIGNRVVARTSNRAHLLPECVEILELCCAIVGFAERGQTLPWGAPDVLGF